MNFPSHDMETTFYLSFLLLHLLLLPPSTSSISFRKTRFEPSDTTIIYEGSATSFVGAIELNDDSYQCQVGRATYSDKILLWDSDTEMLSDFTTYFSSTVDIQRRPIFGAGFTFFIAPVDFQVPMNSAGGFLGLYNITTQKSSTPNQILHIEFDSQPDLEWDPPVQHIGININSLSSVTYAPWNVTLHSSDTADVWISYNGSTKNLTVSWKYRLTANSQESDSLSCIVDLREFLPQWVKIGFSAATRDFVERHAVYSWDFSSSLEADEKHPKNAKRLGLLLFIAGPIAIVLLGVMAIGTGVLCRTKLMKGKKKKINLTSIDKDIEKGRGPQRFSYNDLVLATKNFSSESKLDTAIYEGYLAHLKMAVSVKKLQSDSKEVKRKYITEVKILSKINHKNIVQLIGCCHENDELLLVYESISSSKKLDSNLFGERKSLTWNIRYKLVLELAYTLLYLHEELEQCVVHGNIKLTSIMLDSDSNVKIFDFGLAQLVDHELRQASESVKTDGISKESDVYGFGVAVLEIVSGRKVTEPIEETPDMGFVEWISHLYRNGTLRLAVDKRLVINECDLKQMECLIIVGLWCANPDKSLRPSIRQAVHVLKFDAVLPKLFSH